MTSSPKEVKQYVSQPCLSIQRNGLSYLYRHTKGIHTFSLVKWACASISVLYLFLLLLDAMYVLHCLTVTPYIQLQYLQQCGTLLIKILVDELLPTK